MNFPPGGNSALERYPRRSSILLLFYLGLVSIKRSGIFEIFLIKCIIFYLLNLGAFHSSWPPLCDHFLAIS